MLLERAHADPRGTTTTGTHAERLLASRSTFIAEAALGDWESAVAEVSALLDAGAEPDELVHRLIVPVQREAGARWAANLWGVVEEHLCTGAAEASLTLLDSADAGRPRGGHLVAACVEGEQHALPARIVATELRRAAWRVSFLGAGTPAAELRTFAATHRPDAVLLSCTLAENLSGAAASVAAAQAAGTPVLVGGAAFGSDDLRALRVGADGWATTGQGALRLLEELPAHPRRRALEARLPASAEEGRHLADASRLLANVAAGSLAVMAGADQWFGSADRIAPVLRTLAGALAVDDERVVDAYVGWLADFCEARGHGRHLVYQVLLAVQSAVPESFSATGRLLRRAIDRLADAELEVEVDGPVVAPAANGANGTHGSAGRAVVFSAAPVVARPVNEDARLAALRAYAVREESAADDHLRALVDVAATVCEAPVAYLSFIDGDTQWLKSAVGTSLRSIARDEAICSRTILQSDVVVAPDLATHPEFADSPLVVDGPLWRFYAGAPVLVGRDLAIGTVAVVDHRPRTLSARQCRSLKALSADVSAHLELARRPAGPDGWAPTARGRAEQLLASVAERREGQEGGAPELLSTKEVARLFGVSSRTVANWAAAGRLPTVQTAGGHYRFAIDAVADLLLEARGSSGDGSGTHHHSVG